VQSFTEAQIAEKLKVAEALRQEGKRVYEIARILGVTDTTYYNWLKRAEKPMRSEDELRRLRRENAQLKRAVKSLANLAGADLVSHPSPLRGGSARRAGVGGV
jgi:transposase-like protein